MSLSAALQVAYASNPKGPPPLETLELDNATFASPARLLVSGGNENVMLPLTLGGDPVEFIWCPTQVTLPGVSVDGPTPMRLRINNVTKVLLPYLRLAVGSTLPITVVYRAYAASDLTQPGQVLSGFRIKVASMDAASVEATVTLKEIELQAFPLLTYDETYYPTLQNN